MNISQAAERSGVPAKTIRYYEDIGLIPPAERTASGYRQYAGKDVETLRFINRARSLGFSVADVQALLGLWRDRQRASRDVRAMAERHLEVIEQKIAELQTMRDTLTDLVGRCHGDDRPDCPILGQLADDPGEGDGEQCHDRTASV